MCDRAESSTARQSEDTSHIPEMSLLPPRPPRIEFGRPLPQITQGRGYSVVEELKTVSAGISLLDVLRACPDQQELLFQTLGIEAPPSSTSQCTFDFSRAPAVDPNSVPNFYISVFLSGSRAQRGPFVHKALVDDGSSVNLLPYSVYERIEPRPQMEKCSYTCTGYEGTALLPMGKVTLTVELSGKEVTTEFAVIHRDFSFNVLLGRPWLTQMQAVCSSVFGELQFMHNGRIHAVKRYELPQLQIAHITHAGVDIGDGQQTVIETRGVGQYWIGDLFEEKQQVNLIQHSSPTLEKKEAFAKRRKRNRRRPSSCHGSGFHQEVSSRDTLPDLGLHDTSAPGHTMSPSTKLEEQPLVSNSTAQDNTRYAASVLAKIRDVYHRYVSSAQSDIEACHIIDDGPKRPKTTYI